MEHPSTSPDQPGSSQYPLPHSNGSDSFHHSQTGWTSPRRADGAIRNERVAKALGWFSIGLGLAELLAPRTVARAAGVAHHPILLRALGAREIASGVGILSNRKPTGWLWSRVAGDAMDLALLGIAAGSPGIHTRRRNRMAAVTAAVAGVAALDILTSVQQGRQDRAGKNGMPSGTVHVEKCITINRSADECYRFWRDFGNFPRFMKHLESVQVKSDTRSHWVAKAPAGASVEWDAEVTVDQPGQLLAWRSIEGADVDNAGTVSFERAAGGRGTIVRVALQYSPPGGTAGALIAKLLGEEPAQQINQDLLRFKQLIETGEIPTTEGQPSGLRSPIVRMFRKGEPG